MKRESSRYLITVFIDCFLLILAGLATFAYLVNLDLLDMKLLMYLPLIAAVLSLALTGLNLMDNRAERRALDQDIERLLENEQPEDKQLEKIYDRLHRMSEELQSLSKDTTQMRTEIVEKERKRISRELHDSVSQELFAATMILSGVTETDHPDAAQLSAQAKLAQKILHEAQNEMRALLLHLRPVELDGKSLTQGLRALIDELSAKISSSISYRLTEIETTQTIEDNLFRMAQEILSNALRHSQAENINLSLIERQNNIILTIGDDGNGFDVKDEKSASYGLKNLQERAHLLAGEMKLRTAPNAGTEVEIRIPKIKK